MKQVKNMGHLRDMKDNNFDAHIIMISDKSKMTLGKLQDVVNSIDGLQVVFSKDFGVMLRYCGDDNPDTVAARVGGKVMRSVLVANGGGVV